MKLLSLIFLVFALFFSTGKISGQTNSDGVTLNIRFRPVQTITIQPSQKSIDINYSTQEDYNNGVSVTLDDHVSVFSSSGFQVKVEAGSDNFDNAGGATTIPVSDVVVNASAGSGNHNSNIYNSVPLSTMPEPLITSANGGRGLNYSVTYDNSAAGSAGAYEGNYATSGNDETVYSAEITYSITPN